MPTRRLIRRYLLALTASDDDRRWEAAKKLVDRGGWRLRLALEEIALRHPRHEARAAAAWTLGFRMDQRAAATLAAILSNTDEHPSVRAHAAEALGHLSPSELRRDDVTSAVMKGLDDVSAEVRFWSIFAAATIPIRAATDRIRVLAAEDGTVVEGWWPVSVEAEWALRMLSGDPRAHDSLPSFQ